MNAPDNMYLPDVQASADRRNLAIQRVGIKSLAHPVMVATTRGPQPSVASIDMYVGLPAHQKGTHMSIDATEGCGPRVVATITGWASDLMPTR